MAQYEAPLLGNVFERTQEVKNWVVQAFPSAELVEERQVRDVSLHFILLPALEHMQHFYALSARAKNSCSLRSYSIGVALLASLLLKFYITFCNVLKSGS